MSNQDSERAAFEAWISAPPYEKDIARNSTGIGESAWPGLYRVYDVQLAWEAWQECRKLTPTTNSAQSGISANV